MTEQDNNELMRSILDNLKAHIEKHHFHILFQYISIIIYSLSDIDKFRVTDPQLIKELDDILRLNFETLDRQAAHPAYREKLRQLIISYGVALCQYPEVSINYLGREERHIPINPRDDTFIIGHYRNLLPLEGEAQDHILPNPLYEEEPVLSSRTYRERANAFAEFVSRKPSPEIESLDFLVKLCDIAFPYVNDEYKNNPVQTFPEAFSALIQQIALLLVKVKSDANHRYWQWLHIYLLKIGMYDLQNRQAALSTDLLSFETLCPPEARHFLGFQAALKRLAEAAQDLTANPAQILSTLCDFSDASAGITWQVTPFGDIADGKLFYPFQQELLNIRQGFSEALKQGEDFFKTQAHASMLTKGLIAKVMQACALLLGAAPSQGDFLLTGSVARLDISSFSDFEGAYVFDDKHPNARAYHLTLMRLFDIAIIAFGETPTEGGTMQTGFTIDKCCHPLNQDFHQSEASENSYFFGSHQAVFDYLTQYFHYRTDNAASLDVKLKALISKTDNERHFVERLISLVFYTVPEDAHEQNVILKLRAFIFAEALQDKSVQEIWHKTYMLPFLDTPLSLQRIKALEKIYFEDNIQIETAWTNRKIIAIAMLENILKEAKETIENSLLISIRNNIHDISLKACFYQPLTFVANFLKIYHGMSETSPKKILEKSVENGFISKLLADILIEGIRQIGLWREAQFSKLKSQDERVILDENMDKDLIHGRKILTSFEKNILILLYQGLILPLEEALKENFTRLCESGADNQLFIFDSQKIVRQYIATCHALFGESIAEYKEHPLIKRVYDMPSGLGGSFSCTEKVTKLKIYLNKLLEKTISREWSASSKVLELPDIVFLPSAVLDAVVRDEHGLTQCWLVNRSILMGRSQDISLSVSFFDEERRMGNIYALYYLAGLLGLHIAPASLLARTRFADEGAKEWVNRHFNVFTLFELKEGQVTAWHDALENRQQDIEKISANMDVQNYQESLIYRLIAFFNNDLIQFQISEQASRQAINITSRTPILGEQVNFLKSLAHLDFFLHSPLLGRPISRNLIEKILLIDPCALESHFNIHKANINREFAAILQREYRDNGLKSPEREALEVIDIDIRPVKYELLKLQALLKRLGANNGDICGHELILGMQPKMWHAFCHGVVDNVFLKQDDSVTFNENAADNTVSPGALAENFKSEIFWQRGTFFESSPDKNQSFKKQQFYLDLWSSCQIPDEITRLDLSYCEVLTDDKLLALVKKFTKLRYINISFCNNLNRQSLFHLSLCEHLEELHFNSNQNLNTLAPSWHERRLTFRNLKTLSLSNNPHLCFIELGIFPRLERICLTGSGFEENPASITLGSVDAFMDRLYKKSSLLLQEKKFSEYDEVMVTVKCFFHQIKLENIRFNIQRLEQAARKVKRDEEFRRNAQSSVSIVRITNEGGDRASVEISDFTTLKIIEYLSKNERALLDVLVPPAYLLPLPRSIHGRIGISDRMEALLEDILDLLARQQLLLSTLDFSIVIARTKEQLKGLINRAGTDLFYDLSCSSVFHTLYAEKGLKEESVALSPSNTHTLDFLAIMKEHASARKVTKFWQKKIDAVLQPLNLIEGASQKMGEVLPRYKKFIKNKLAEHRRQQMAFWSQHLPFAGDIAGELLARAWTEQKLTIRRRVWLSGSSLEAESLSVDDITPSGLSVMMLGLLFSRDNALTSSWLLRSKFYFEVLERVVANEAWAWLPVLIFDDRRLNLKRRKCAIQLDLQMSSESCNWTDGFPRRIAEIALYEKLDKDEFRYCETFLRLHEEYSLLTILNQKMMMINDYESWYRRKLRTTAYQKQFEKVYTSEISVLLDKYYKRLKKLPWILHEDEFISAQNQPEKFNEVVERRVNDFRARLRSYQAIFESELELLPHIDMLKRFYVFVEEVAIRIKANFTALDDAYYRDSFKERMKIIEKLTSREPHFMPLPHYPSLPLDKLYYILGKTNLSLAMTHCATTSLPVRILNGESYQDKKILLLHRLILESKWDIVGLLLRNGGWHLLENFRRETIFMLKPGFDRRFTDRLFLCGNEDLLFDAAEYLLGANKNLLWERKFFRDGTRLLTHTDDNGMTLLHKLFNQLIKNHGKLNRRMEKLFLDLIKEGAPTTLKNAEGHSVWSLLGTYADQQEPEEAKARIFRQQCIDFMAQIQYVTINSDEVQGRYYNRQGAFGALHREVIGEIRGLRAKLEGFLDLAYFLNSAGDSILGTIYFYMNRLYCPQTKRLAVMQYILQIEKAFMDSLDSGDLEDLRSVIRHFDSTYEPIVVRSDSYATIRASFSEILESENDRLRKQEAEDRRKEQERLARETQQQKEDRRQQEAERLRQAEKAKRQVEEERSQREAAEQQAEEERSQREAAEQAAAAAEQAAAAAEQVAAEERRKREAAEARLAALEALLAQQAGAQPDNSAVEAPASPGLGRR